MHWALALAERGWVPDPLIRRGIRHLLSRRRRALSSRPELGAEVVESMRRSPLAIEVEAANEQHYELPPAFFEAVLGRHLKYSCGYWRRGERTLDGAEAAALELSADRAGIENGMRVLDLGCGWGSFSLWVAERYPACRITAVSNSAPQGEHIRQRALSRGLENVEVLTADMNRLRLVDRWDRIVSIEMFEHMRNWGLLLDRIGGWLAPQGKLFVHIFCHRTTPYFFENKGPSDWMARHFFTGGLMPSETLLDEFGGAVELERRWSLDGRHYEKTSLAWLDNMDRRIGEIREIFHSVYGGDADRWIQRWRLFFLACAELFAADQGREWYVSHSLWRRQPSAAARPGGPDA